MSQWLTLQGITRCLYLWFNLNPDDFGAVVTVFRIPLGGTVSSKVKTRIEWLG